MSGLKQPNQIVKKLGLYGSEFPPLIHLGRKNYEKDLGCDMCMLLWTNIRLAQDRDDIISERHLIALLERHVNDCI